MRTLRLISLVSIFCLVSISASAQQATSSAAEPTTSDPQAVALIQRSLTALTGGVPVTDVTLTGTAQRIAGSDDEFGTATLKATALGDSRVDLVLQSGNHSEIRNHSAIPLPSSLPANLPPALAQLAPATQPTGAWSGPDAVLHGIASQNCMTDATWFFPALTLARVASSQNYLLSYVGSETLPSGEAVVHVSASELPTQAVTSGTNVPVLPGASLAPFLQHLSQMDFYFDPTTSLPVALAFNIHPDGNALLDIPTQVDFWGYQAVNGVLVPFHVQKLVNSSLVLDLQFTGATLNSGLAAASFQIQ